MGGAPGISGFCIWTNVASTDFRRNLECGSESVNQSKLALPLCEERAIYVAKRGFKITHRVIPEIAMVVLPASEGVVIEATEQARIALIGGEKMGKRFIEWNLFPAKKSG